MRYIVALFLVLAGVSFCADIESNYRQPVYTDDFTNSADYTVGGSGLVRNLARSYTLEDCEDAWNASASVTGSLDTTNEVVGSGCVSFTVAAAFTTGLIAYEYKDNAAFDYCDKIDLAVYCSIATADGDLQLLLDDTNACASPVATLNIPALSAGKWHYVRLTIPTPSLMTASVDYIGISAAVDLGTDTVVKLDNITAVTPYVKQGAGAVMITSATADGVGYNLFKNIATTSFVGTDIRLKYYCYYRDDAKGTHVKAHLRLYGGDTADAVNYGRINLPCAIGWNEVEISYGNVVVAGTFDPTAAIESLSVFLGTAGTAGKEIFKTGEFAVWDSLEVVSNGLTKGAIIIQFDDATVESLDEMSTYAAKYGIPVQIYVQPDTIGQQNATTPGIRYADLDVITKATRDNVMLGVHSKASIGVDISEGAVRGWCRKYKKWFIDNGFARDADYMALPGGQILSMTDGDALRVMGEYFKSVRGTMAYYQEGYDGYLGENTYGFNVVRPVNYVWSFAQGIDENWQTYVDKAISTKCLLILYAHGLSERSPYADGRPGYWTLTRAVYQAFIDYVATKAAAGDLSVITLEDLLRDYPVQTKDPSTSSGSGGFMGGGGIFGN